MVLKQAFPDQFLYSTSKAFFEILFVCIFPSNLLYCIFFPFMLPYKPVTFYTGVGQRSICMGQKVLFILMQWLILELLEAFPMI